MMIKIICSDVEFIPSQGYWPGYFSIQTYSSSTSGPYNQNLSDITIRDADGNKVPTKNRRELCGFKLIATTK